MYIKSILTLFYTYSNEKYVLSLIFFVQSAHFVLRYVNPLQLEDFPDESKQLNLTHLFREVTCVVTTKSLNKCRKGTFYTLSTK
jgi:hypothetical protein